MCVYMYKNTSVTLQFYIFTCNSNMLTHRNMPKLSNVKQCWQGQRDTAIILVYCFTCSYLGRIENNRGPYHFKSEAFKPKPCTPGTGLDMINSWLPIKAPVCHFTTINYFQLWSTVLWKKMLNTVLLWDTCFSLALWLHIYLSNKSVWQDHTTLDMICLQSYSYCLWSFSYIVLLCIFRVLVL